MSAERAERAMLFSLLLPGLGHLYLGLRRRGLFTLVGFISCSVLAVLLSRGTLKPMAGRQDLYFTFVWSVLALWFFAMADSYESGRSGVADGPNPRIAFLLNFCARGLGYFYADRPWYGAACIVGGAWLLAHTPPQWLAFSGVALLGMQLLTALHAYVCVGGYAWSWERWPRLVFPTAVVVLSSLLSLQLALHAAARMPQPRLADADTGTRVVRFPRANLTLTMPSGEWTLEQGRTDGVLALCSPRASLLLVSDDTPMPYGLDGYLVTLAGELAREHHGEIHLLGQRTLACADGQAHEVYYQWQDENGPGCSHLFLVSQGGQVHAFIVASPANLTGNLRAEVESLVTSVRFSEP
jgi:hypothetical protein